MKPRMRPASFAALLALALLLGALRLIHLDADTPDHVSRWSAGLYVDEGYKTLSARNLIVHGQAIWHPHDTYPGWLDQSPLSQWAYYTAFRLFGVDVTAARSVSVLIWTLVLLTFLLAFAGRYPPPLLAVGLIGLGLQPTLFFFSRVATFEVLLAAGVVAMLIAVARLEERPALTLMAVALIGVGMTLGIKGSAPLYVLPILAGSAVAWWYSAGRSVRTHSWAWVGLGLLAAVLLYLTRSIWLARLGLEPLDTLRRIALPPVAPAAPFLWVPGMLCGVHGLLCRPREYLRSPYRASLLALVFLLPLSLGLFSYAPLRYYVPGIPASLFLVLEWMRLGGAHDRVPKHPTFPVSVAAIGGLGLSLFYLANGLNSAFLERIPLAIGAEPGLGDDAMLGIFAPLAAIAAFLLWRWRDALLDRTTLRASSLVFSLLFAAHAAVEVGGFLIHPGFASSELRTRIAQRVEAGKTVAGDWAPFFCLGTSADAFYMSDAFNRPERILLLRPDYLLLGDSAGSRETSRVLRTVDGVRIGAPIASGHLRGTVTLHRLRYDASPASP